jgi:hypothetical protein
MKNPSANKSFIKKPLVIYPFLFAVFPVLFLYAYNIGETAASQIWIPMAASVLLTLLLVAILSVILRDVVKAGVATVIFLFLFFSYGRLYELLEKWGVFVPSHWYLIPVLLLVWGYCIYLIKTSKWNFRNATNVLNIVAIVLIAINLFSIAAYETRMARLPSNDLHKQESSTATAEASPNLSNMPDIYYIILDEYAHSDTMLEYYNYDNSQFTEDLKQMGFFIASSSETSTPQTYESFATSLNMSYEYITQPKEIVYQKVADNEVVNFLKARGYKYIYFGNWYEIGRWKVIADTYYNFYADTSHGLITTEFSDVFWQTTMLRPFARQIMKSEYESNYRRGVLNVLQYLKKMPQMNGPKFVFCHLICPHIPFMFGPNGEYIDSVNWYNFKDKQFYLGQYIFISNEIENTVRYILKESSVEPIIILQSDHGLRLRWGQNSPDIGKNEWKKILNAYYLPGNGREKLYDSISPVNSFRVIFNYYFNTNYPLLEDSKSIYPDN